MTAHPDYGPAAFQVAAGPAESVTAALRTDAAADLCGVDTPLPHLTTDEQPGQRQRLVIVR